MKDKGSGTGQWGKTTPSVELATIVTPVFDPVGTF